MMINFVRLAKEGARVHFVDSISVFGSIAILSD